MNDLFEEVFPKVEAARRAGAERGLGQAAIQLLTDATIEVPKTPHWRGVLRSSGSVFLMNRHIHSAKKEGPRAGAVIPKDRKENPTPATKHHESIGRDELVAVVGFNTKYAMRMHEGVGLNFKESGTGAKFLITPAVNNRSTYMKIIAKEAQK